MTIPTFVPRTWRLALGCLPLIFSAAADAQEGRSFAECVSELQTTARSEGISQGVVENVLGQVTQLDRVIELD
ncbi:MAG: hypothetical protein ACODAC_07600, partial [Pseudomonadota bacterium]